MPLRLLGGAESAVHRSRPAQLQWLFPPTLHCVTPQSSVRRHADESGPWSPITGVLASGGMRTREAVVGPVFVGAGLLHFVIPKTYQRIVPPYLPAPRALVYASGAAEIAGGLGLMSRAWRRPSGYWLIATLLAVFPANVHMALHPEDFPDVPGGSVVLWARLPFQGVFICWILRAMNR